MFNRVVLIVLDGVGIGALPDAADYGDADSATLQHVAQATGGLNLPHLQRMGLGNIADILGVAPVSAPAASWGKMRECSAGKDSVVGHWELTGVIQRAAFKTFPHGFPADVIAAFTAETGLPVLGNIAASGTDILVRYGEKHLETGWPIVYTSVDSVLQVAAHEDLISREELYRLCRVAERIVAPYRVCRVIARPFRGRSAQTFERTSGRHDFPYAPPQQTLLDAMRVSDQTVCGVGKVVDLFAGRGFSRTVPTSDNDEGMRQALTELKGMRSGLLFVNLVDFDMVYGHRCDPTGFARALEQFDAWLPELQKELGVDDLLLITADHGCDPTTPGTDHTREYVPLLARSLAVSPGRDLGIRSCFADVGATLAENFDVSVPQGQSFLARLEP